MKKRGKRVLGAYNKQYKQRCCKCGKYGHKPCYQKWPENEKAQKLDDKKEKNDYKEKFW